MIKDFIKWHELKSQLEIQENLAHFHEREVWLASLGVNLGHEEDGKYENFWRPVIVLKKFSRDLFLSIPLTSTIKSHPYYFSIEINGRRSTALLSQLRSLDRKRLLKKIAIISEVDFIEINKKIVEFFELETQTPSLGGGLQTPCQLSEAEAIVDSSYQDHKSCQP